MQVMIGVTNSDTRNTNKPFTVKKRCNIVNKEPVDLLHPCFSVNGFSGYADCNYLYIPVFKRYYFITKREIDNYNMLWIEGMPDDLSNWWSYLKNINCLIERQEFVWNPFIQDTLLPVRTERQISFKKIGNIGNPKGQNIVLTVGGGKHLE